MRAAVPIGIMFCVAALAFAQDHARSTRTCEGRRRKHQVACSVIATGDTRNRHRTATRIKLLTWR